MRDIALGVLTWQVRNDPMLLRHAFRINAAIDASDMTVAALPLLGRRGNRPRRTLDRRVRVHRRQRGLTLLRRSAASD